MRLAYVCTDRDVILPGPGGPAREVQRTLLALQGAGHDVTFFGAGEGGVVPGAWRVVRQRAGNGPKELRAHYLEKRRGRGLAATAEEVWSLSLNHRLGRTLEEERLRAPLDCVVERLSPWTYAAAAFSHQRRVPYVLEVPAPPIWERWRNWDGELETAAQCVHAFTASLARLVLVHDEAAVPLYRSLTNAPVVVLRSAAGAGPGEPRPAWAEGFVIVHAGPASPLEDIKTIAVGAAALPEGFSFLRMPMPDDSLAWAGAAVVPGTVGAPPDIGAVLAARLPLIVPKGSAAARLSDDRPLTVYAPGDPASLTAAMVAIRGLVAERMRPRPQPVAKRLAELVTRSFEAPVRV